MPKLELPNYGEHIVYLGATGSGKTYLAETIISHFDSYFSIDNQDSVDLEGKVLTSPKNLKFYLYFFKKIRYVPALKYREKEIWNWLFEQLWLSSSKKKPNPRIIHINEIYTLGYGANFPDWIPRCLTTARQRKLGFHIETQRPRAIPLPILTEARKIYVFRLARLDDIKYVCSFAGENIKELEEILQKIRKEDNYSFVEIDARKGSWQYFPAIKRG